MHNTEIALPDWERAHGIPLIQGQIKQTPDDFRVDEILEFSPSCDGEHDYLRIEKTGANTAWVARQLAAHAHVAGRDVGYAGLKDRHAVTTQWFSVRRPTGAGTDWASMELPGIRILEQTRHRRKLKTGAHAGNRFRIVVRSMRGRVDEVDGRLASMRDSGVPNYFGPQRFGRGGRNMSLASALFAGTKLRREQRSMAISAARSFIFNEVLAMRVQSGNWDTILPGEAVNLDGSGSYFLADEKDDRLAQRLQDFDVHPTGPLWGMGAVFGATPLAEVERTIGEQYAELAAGLERIGLQADRRATRLAVREAEWNSSGDDLELKFRLGKGGYATTVLRELMETDGD